MRKKEQPKYSRHFETIIALVSHLALTCHKSRTPANLAKFIGLDEMEVKWVLNSYHGLFRKSINLSSNGENFYTLQLRYSRRWLDEESNNPSGSTEQEEPLKPEYLSALFELVLRIVEQEKAWSRQKILSYTTLGASSIAALAAVIAAIFSIMG